jgi:GT2 family glycosyltransferase
MRIFAAVPTIGRVETLLMTLHSIASQTLKPDEFILLDESESPVTRHYPIAQALDLMSVEGIEVRIIRNRHARGIGPARYRLAREAGGGSLFMVDDDIVLRETCLERLNEGLDACEEASWAAPYCFLINGEGRKGYVDTPISRQNPLVKKMILECEVFIQYFNFDESPFYERINVAGTQAILFRRANDIILNCKGICRMGKLPREDTLLTNILRPGVFVSDARCDHYVDPGQEGRPMWETRMFYKIHEAVMKDPEAFIKLIGEEKDG